MTPQTLIIKTGQINTVIRLDPVQHDSILKYFV
jgi:hypothetical protein